MVHGAPAPPLEGVLVAAELSPADVVSLDPRAVIGLATAAGAPLSHAAILARGLGIPAVTGLGADVLGILPGTVVLVDGDAGTVRVNPTDTEMEGARRRQLAGRRRQDEARRLATTPAVTRDGRTVAVLVNVGSVEDARLAVCEGADGVGMLRTEFAFLGRQQPPGEEEQYLAYRAIADVVGDRPLVVRTLDLGADVPAWNARPEPNPALGNRGLRLTLADEDLFNTQLRAIARLASDRRIGVMFPMVTTIDELRRAHAHLRSVTERSVAIGITVEVPAAALTAEVFARAVDFFAVGTNDLTQYTLAVDRTNAAVSALADGLHPAVLRLLREVTAAAERHDRPVSVVGELGCDRLAIPVLLGLGVTALSVRPNAVAEVKQVVRAVALDEARALAEAALQAESATAVRQLAAQHRR
ncbi:MAG TPA: phosphoenolpyruvate--protein phosphotransferase [Acidimicrobiales bacterium]